MNCLEKISVYELNNQNNENSQNKILQKAILSRENFVVQSFMIQIKIIYQLICGVNLME